MKKCLTNTTIFFFGDSQQRNLYSTLYAYLHNEDSIVRNYSMKTFPESYHDPYFGILMVSNQQLNIFRSLCRLETALNARVLLPHTLPVGRPSEASKFIKWHKSVPTESKQLVVSDKVQLCFFLPPPTSFLASKYGNWSILPRSLKWREKTARL